MSMDAGGPEEFAQEDAASLAKRVVSLELQVGDLNLALDNLTTEFVRLRLKLEDVKAGAASVQAAPPPVVAPQSLIDSHFDGAELPPLRPTSPSPPPPPQVFVKAAPPPMRAEGRSLEQRLGSQIFNALGILALIFGASYGLKLAIEHGLIGPMGRVLIGLILGAGLVVWSERFRHKGYAAFSYSLKAVGSSILYLSLWASFQLYHLLPAGAALGAMVLVTAWNAFMAFTQDSELLAAYALVGGFLTPALVSSGGNHETFLFSYLAAINLGLILLLRFKPWLRLIIINFPATVLYFVAWYSEHFHSASSRELCGQTAFSHVPCNWGWDGASTETAVFALVFAALFVVPSLWARASREELGRDAASPALGVLLPLANAVFVACALYSIFEDSGLHSALAWVAVALAAMYLGLMRLQPTALGRAVHLAVAVVLLTAAIPLKASGHTLTTAWLVEGIVLFWLSGKFSAEEDSASRMLRGLAVSGYLLGLSSLCVHWTFEGVAAFLSANLASAMIALAALAGAIVLVRQTYAEDREARRAAIAPLTLALLGCALVGGLLLSPELIGRWSPSGAHPAFFNVDFANAVLGLMVFAVTTFLAYQLAMEDRRGRDRLLSLAGGALVLFNLAAILAIEHEITAFFYDHSNSGSPDAMLGRSLSISGFLMLYGAGLLAFGFWKQSAFVRWQALVLMIFTIAKVFLYDTSELSQGYRVASVLGLGVLLLGVSFAYQKDWLNLRKPAADAPVEGEAR